MEHQDSSPLLRHLAIISLLLCWIVSPEQQPNMVSKVNSWHSNVLFIVLCGNVVVILTFWHVPFHSVMHAFSFTGNKKQVNHFYLNLLCTDLYLQNANCLYAARACISFSLLSHYIYRPSPPLCGRVSAISFQYCLFSVMSVLISYCLSEITSNVG